MYEWNALFKTPWKLKMGIEDVHWCSIDWCVILSQFGSNLRNKGGKREKTRSGGREWTERCIWIKHNKLWVFLESSWPWKSFWLISFLLAVLSPLPELESPGYEPHWEPPGAGDSQTSDRPTAASWSLDLAGYNITVGSCVTSRRRTRSAPCRGDVMPWRSHGAKWWHRSKTAPWEIADGRSGLSRNSAVRARR